MRDNSQPKAAIPTAQHRRLADSTRHRINAFCAAFCAAALSVTMFLPMLGIDSISGFRGGNPSNWPLVRTARARLAGFAEGMRVEVAAMAIDSSRRWSDNLPATINPDRLGNGRANAAWFNTTPVAFTAAAQGRSAFAPGGGLQLPAMPPAAQTIDYSTTASYGASRVPRRMSLVEIYTGRAVRLQKIAALTQHREFKDTIRADFAASPHASRQAGQARPHGRRHPAGRKLPAHRTAKAAIPGFSQGSLLKSD